MKKTEYAIVDIETTGGNASHSRITEIAIVIHDGREVLERWETLVDPEQDIPAPIFALTGIDNELVRNAPTFEKVAETIHNLLEGRIFVAHNVNFDFSFVRHQLTQEGYRWTPRKLCTVRTARKIRPGLPSYSLGNLCRSLDIPLENRHRAGGDADATALLFSKLIAWDTEGEIEKMVKKTAQDQRLPPNLPRDDFERLPEKPGVYYFYSQEKKAIYVGKAVNIKKRVASHFSDNSTSVQRQNFLKDIHGISFEECANELMALLLECSEIQKLWPKYNRALKRFEPKFGLYSYEARNGYRYLAVGKLPKFQSCISAYDREHEAMEALRELARKFAIDPRFCCYGRPVAGEFTPQQNTAPLPDIGLHNASIEEALASLKEGKESYAYLDKGRHAEERSCVYVENGAFYGMGYFPSDASVADLSELKEYIDPCKSSHYVMKLIASFAARHPGKVKPVNKDTWLNAYNLENFD